MAMFTFRRTDTGKSVEFKANGKKFAMAQAAVKLDLRANQLHLLDLVRQVGKIHNGNKPRTRRHRTGW